ncbi:MAG: BolA family transcriptional regulator [Bdellovibrionales bacterium]|nr:BolA family transcriptional regulator [Bdellovibrionales bacterium]
MSVEQQIRDKLTSHLQIELLEVVNESPYHQVPEGAETHFRVLIVSKDFKDLSTVKRHQKVYQILKEELHGPVHAFSQKTLTPEEWKNISFPIPSSPPCQKKS